MRTVIRNALACAFLTSLAAGCGGDESLNDQGELEGPNESVAELGSQIDVSAVQVQGKIGLALAGSRLQVSNTSTGVPHAGDGAMSYFKVGPLLAQNGQADRVFDVPVFERDLGAKVVAAEYFGTGGTLIVDKIRLKVNGLAADLGVGNPALTLDYGGIVANLELQSGHPTLFCDGNAWLPPFLGFPIPLGWRDDACPDFELRNLHIQVRLVPGVSASSQLVIDDIGVTLSADIDAGTIPNALNSLYDWKAYVRGKVETQLRQLLLADKAKGVFASALTQLIDNVAGTHVPMYARVRVDPAGLHAFPGTACVPTTCAARGARCGTIGDGCGTSLDCGTCGAGVCMANHCVQTRAECLARCDLQRTACGRGGRSPIGCATSYRLCTQGCPAR